VWGGNTFGTERLTLQSTTGSGQILVDVLTLKAGNVGIGTTSPAVKLDVVGAISSTTDATLSGLTVGKGAGAIASNTALGSGALNANTTGVNNTASGLSALQNNTTGSQNTASGRNALQNNTTGTSNTAHGLSALQNNTTGGSNTASGVSALFSNTTGAQNTANGQGALQANTTASNNTAVGYQAGYSNTTGTNNTASGQSALYSNTTGNNNTASGYQALLSNTTGYNNTASGRGALTSNTTGNSNAAHGLAALRDNTTGVNNTASGVAALQLNTTGNSNTAVGYQASYSGTTGAQNTTLGYTAGYSNIANNNTFIGERSGYNNTTGAQNTFLGQYSGYGATSGIFNTFIGDASGSAITTGSKNTILGGYSGNQGGLDIRTASNYIVLSDGDGNPRAYWNGANATFGGGLAVTGNLYTTANVAGTTATFVNNNAATTGVRFYHATDLNGTGNPFITCDAGASVLRAAIRSNGGLANYSANNVNLSDKREKINFAPAKDYLPIICAIPVQTFNYIDQNHEDDPGLTLGVVAQDVKAVAPEMVMESNWGTKEEPKMRLSVYQTDLQYALMKCIQELNAKFDAYVLTHP